MKKGEKNERNTKELKTKSQTNKQKKKQEDICEHISTGKTKERNNVFMFYVVMSD